MLPREVRGCFFQERVLHFQLAVEPFEFPQPGPLRYLQRRLMFCMLFPLGPDPVAERRLVDPQLPRDIRYSTRGFYYHPGCFFPELW